MDEFGEKASRLKRALLVGARFGDLGALLCSPEFDVRGEDEASGTAYMLFVDVPDSYRNVLKFPS